MVTELDCVELKYLLQHLVRGPEHSCVQLILAEKGLHWPTVDEEERHKVTLITLFPQAGSPELFSEGPWSKLSPGTYCCHHVSGHFPTKMWLW